jgi:hypothetical protein
MFPNNFSSQYYASQERAENFRSHADEDGIPSGAQSYRPGGFLKVFYPLFLLLKALVLIILLPEKLILHLLRPKMITHPRLRGIH